MPLRSWLMVVNWLLIWPSHLSVVLGQGTHGCTNVDLWSGSLLHMSFLKTFKAGDTKNLEQKVLHMHPRQRSHSGSSKKLPCTLDHVLTKMNYPSWSSRLKFHLFSIKRIYLPQTRFCTCALNKNCLWPQRHGGRCREWWGHCTNHCGDRRGPRANPGEGESLFLPLISADVAMPGFKP